MPEHVRLCGACLGSCNSKRGGVFTCHVLLQLVSEFTLKVTSQCLSGGRTIQRQRIAQQLSMARLSVGLGYHVDETSQSYTQTGRALIIRLQLRWKRTIHTKRCSFTKWAAFPNHQHILALIIILSVSLTPPFVFCFFFLNRG